MAFAKLNINELNMFQGNGVCDVCNKPISSGEAYIIDNYTFYHSPEYREFDRHSIMSLLTGASKPDSYYETLYSRDTSIGSAVCKDCIHMFAEEREEFQCEGSKLVRYGGGHSDVVIPDNVKSIGDGAFKSCTRVTSVTIPDGVTSIGNDAFNNCSKLVSVKIPDSVTSIGSRAFHATSLTSVTIPDSVKKIGDRAFIDCFKLTSVTLSSGLAAIESDTFHGCRNLKSVIIPGSVRSIGNNAFYECFELSSVTILDGVNSIGSFAFNNCHNLTSVIIPDSVTAIDKDAFKGHRDDRLTVYCPKGSAAWKYCSNLFHRIKHKPVEEAPVPENTGVKQEDKTEETNKPEAPKNTVNIPLSGNPGKPYAFVFICKGPDPNGMRVDNLTMTDRGIYEGLTQSFGFTGPRENVFFYGPEWNKTVYSSWQITGDEGDDMMGKIKEELKKRGFTYGGEDVRSVAYDPSTTYGKMGFIMVFLFINK